MHTLTSSLVMEGLRERANPDWAKLNRGFFKTGPGQYAEKDIFWGIRVPVLRTFAKQFLGMPQIPFEELAKLLQEPVHEARQFALVFLTMRFKENTMQVKEAIYAFYLRHTACMNNWDLVDVSAAAIVGEWLWQTSAKRDVLYKLAVSPIVWERRIALVATHAFLQKKDMHDTLTLCEALLNDTEDLMHKAIGWSLREIGRWNGQDGKNAQVTFLEKHAVHMPRVSLRYMLERFPIDERKKWMAVSPSKRTKQHA